METRFGSYLAFADRPEDADANAAARVTEIENAIKALGATPHEGTLHPKLMPGLRTVTKDRAIFYFTSDDEVRVVRILAVFFGRHDHQRQMLERLMREG